MQAFEYATPSTRQQAVKLLAANWGETEILAGGTDLLALMKDYLSTPKRVVDIKGIKDLYGVGAQGGALRIGALATIEQLAASQLVKQQYPLLVEAALGVASPQIRARGTVGGDLCQRPRCWYYRQGFGLIAESEGKPLVPEGQNKYHAIFGGGPAYFVNPSSLAPALIALDAKVGIFGPQGAREVPVAGFFVSPKSNSERENVLQPNEVLTEIIVPAVAVARSATYEVRQRTVLDWPLVTASVVLRMQGRTVRDARIVLGHVAPTPWRVVEAEEAIRGKAITEETAGQAGEAAVSKAQPLSGNRYKVQLAKTAVKRALLQAVRGA